MTLAEAWAAQALNGLVCGAFYALIALGYSLVYGVLRLMNFAHGDVYMAGAFFCLLCWSGWTGLLGAGPLALALAMISAMALCGLLGLALYRTAYQPLLNQPSSSLLIVAIGASLVLSNGAMAITNGEYRFFPSLMSPSMGSDWGGLHLSWLQLALLAVAALVMAALHRLVNTTDWGRAMRAVAADREASLLMGINTHAVVGATFALGSALAALAGGMACIYYGGLHYSMGYMMGIKAFTAAVIGGVGSLPGAMAGGMLLGLAEALGTQGLGSAWKDAFAFVLLILMLIFRPQGLLGREERSRM